MGSVVVRTAEVIPSMAQTLHPIKIFHFAIFSASKHSLTNPLVPQHPAPVAVTAVAANDTQDHTRHVSPFCPHPAPARAS
jgi:hypothetical protein